MTQFDMATVYGFVKGVIADYTGRKPGKITSKLELDGGLHIDNNGKERLLVKLQQCFKEEFERELNIVRTEFLKTKTVHDVATMVKEAANEK